MPRTPQAKKRVRAATGPSRMKVYSVENGHGGQGVCRAKNIEEVTAEIETAKQENRLARLVRDDGETLIINPDKVFLIGELNLS